MDPSQTETGNPDTGEGLQRQGSVRRAREMLESGQRPEALAPPPVPRPPMARNEEAHITQWPLPDNHMGPQVAHRQPRPFVPRGPPPPRPRRPSDTPASSVYSERSAPGPSPNPPRVRRPAPSFSQPLPYNPPPYNAQEHARTPAKSSGLTSCISVSTEEFNRQSASSVGTIPDFPVPQGPSPAYTQPQLRPPRDPQQNPRRPTMTRQSSVSPIPEESRDSPSFRGGSFPSSRAIPSSWGSGPAESEIVGAYLDEPSGNGHGHGPLPQDENGTLVRQASLGKRGKPSLRTIQKSNPNSTVSDEPAGTTRAPLEQNRFPLANMDGASQNGSNGTGFRDSSSSVSSDSSHELDLEKSPVFLSTAHKHPALNHSTDALEKELELPSSGPNLSDKRPDARRPPRLDMGAVRSAEARGSMTSLPDLIRRATKLATRLDNDRTASRVDLCDEPREFRPPFVQRLRNSGSISDILASFPNPNPGASEGRLSWPVFFKKSGRRNIQSDDSLSASDEKKRPQRCCGMRLGVFILVLIVLLIIIALAVLLPVFLVVVPQQKANVQADKMPSCEETTPCKNGGISVSSGTICSCVCANGYTGTQCTMSGDASCVTTEVNGQNATVGSDLPGLFEDSQDKFNVPLDEFSLMALFSQNNVSCKTENALVSFEDVSVASKTRRRFVTFPELLELDSDSDSQPSPPIPTGGNSPTKTEQALAPRDTIATLHGILIDPSTPTQTPQSQTTTSPPSTATATATNPHTTGTGTATGTTTTSTSTSNSTTTPKPIAKKTVDFARISVLYIFEQTAALDAAMQYSENIQSFLTGAYSGEDKGKGKGDQSFKMDFGAFGMLSQVKVDFEKLRIEMDGVVVGGSAASATPTATGR